MCQASPTTKHIVDKVEETYKSAVFAGIIPDRRHLEDGGYHCCIVHLWANGNADDYSNTRPLDESHSFSVKGRNFSAAFDISMSTADMKRLHANVRRVWLDRSDPRRKYINAINCWDGTGDAVRYDFQANTAKWASPDHKWHTHGDQPRAYVDIHHDEKRAWRAARAYASVMTGEPKAAWIAREEPKPAPVVAKPTPPPAAKPAPRPAAPRPITHRVVRNDTLWGISRRYGASIAQLKAWNGLRSDEIQPGQVLRLAPAPKPTTYRVAKGDTLWEIAHRHKITVNQLKAWNGLKTDTILPGRVLRITK
jgi:LysM repeat protein